MDYDEYDEDNDMQMMDEYPSDGDSRYDLAKKKKRCPTRKSMSSMFNESFNITKINRKNSMASDKTKSIQRDSFKLKLLKSKQIVIYSLTSSI